MPWGKADSSPWAGSLPEISMGDLCRVIQTAISPSLVVFQDKCALSSLLCCVVNPE